MKKKFIIAGLSIISISLAQSVVQSKTAPVNTNIKPVNSNIKLSQPSMNNNQNAIPQPTVIGISETLLQQLFKVQEKPKQVKHNNLEKPIKIVHIGPPPAPMQLPPLLQNTNTNLLIKKTKPLPSHIYIPVKAVFFSPYKGITALVAGGTFVRKGYIYHYKDHQYMIEYITTNNAVAKLMSVPKIKTVKNTNNIKNKKNVEGNG